MMEQDEEGAPKNVSRHQNHDFAQQRASGFLMQPATAWRSPESSPLNSEARQDLQALEDRIAHVSLSKDISVNPFTNFLGVSDVYICVKLWETSGLLEVTHVQDTLESLDREEECG